MTYRSKTSDTFLLRLPKGKQGFTLVETLAAILLLSVALVGPMVIAQKGLQTSLTARDQDTAFNLAQDAIEQIRFLRDSHCLFAGSSSSGCPASQWLAGQSGTGEPSLAPCISTDGSTKCYIDDYVPSVTGCASNVCTAILYDPSKNEYQYQSGNATPFTRTISIKYNPSCSGGCNAAEADVVVLVSWNDPGAHSIQVNESLYDWQ